MFYFACNRPLKHFANAFANVLFYITTSYLQLVFNMLKHLQKYFANVLQHFRKCFSVKHLQTGTVLRGAREAAAPE